VNIVVDSGSFRIPVVNGIGLTMFGDTHYVAPLLRVVYSYSDGVFVDIGANIGRVMLTLAGIDRSIPYVGFEPLSVAACYVERLIRENGLQNTHKVYPIALADYCGAATFMLNGESDVSATLTSSVRPTSMYQDRKSVCVSTGDIQLTGLDRIAAIKIDVEGAEPLVLKGLRETIRKHRPAIIIEVMPYCHLEDNSYDRSYLGELPEKERMRLITGRKQQAETLWSIMEGIGYRFFQVGRGGLRAAESCDSTLEDQDFLVLPEEDVDKL